jgi:hypothetical protein
MTAQSSKALPAEQPPATVLQTLHRDRAGLTHSLDDLNRAAAKLRETGAAEAAVLVEIGAMGSAEIAAMTAWASGGCVGDAPAPDQKQRRALAEKLAVTQAAAIAAKAAGADIDFKIAELNGLIAASDQAIEKATLDTLQVDFGDLHDQHLAAVEAIRKLAAKLHGLCSFLSNEGRRRIDNGDHEGGKRYLARAEALTTVKLASPGVTQDEIIRAASDWSRSAAALSKSV